MNAIVFVGPTLRLDEARATLEATYLPPAGQGDVLLAARRRPHAIGIIDGYFERVPAVWHKEVLWALSQGIHVFGAASMGALRAAELNRFGMKGVGQIYEAYAAGECEDDDEVALAHADAEHDFRPASEPMVNIRATLASAVKASIISYETRARLEALAKAAFYPDRSYAALLRAGHEQQLPARELEDLADFLGRSRIDVKRADALEMLQQVKACCDRAEPFRAAFSLFKTEAWLEAQRSALERERAT